MKTKRAKKKETRAREREESGTRPEKKRQYRNYGERQKKKSSICCLCSKCFFSTLLLFQDRQKRKHHGKSHFHCLVLFKKSFHVHLVSNDILKREHQKQLEKHTKTTSLFLFHPVSSLSLGTLQFFPRFVLFWFFTSWLFQNALFSPFCILCFCVYLFFLSFTTRHCFFYCIFSKYFNVSI